MKMKVVYIILIAIFMPLTLASDLQDRTKICIYTDSNQTQMEHRLNAFVKRELRATGKYDIVNQHADWTYLVQFCVLEHEFTNNNKTGWVSIAVSVSQVVPKFSLKSYNFNGFFRPTLLLHVGVAHYSISNLDEYAILFADRFGKIQFKIVNFFDKEYLRN